MRIQIPGMQSYFETERLTWTMTYPIVGTKKYTEVGLHFHISPAEAGQVEAAISAAVGAAIGKLEPIVSTLVGVASYIVQRIATNPDGSIDFRIAPHGFQIDHAPSGDPNIWFYPAWGPVYAALEAIQNAPVGVALQDSMMVSGNPPSASGVSGQLMAAEPIELPAELLMSDTTVAAATAASRQAAPMTFSGSSGEIGTVLAMLRAPDAVKQGFTAAASNGDCTRTWGNKCVIPGTADLGCEVTLTCTFTNPDGTKWTQTKTWCSPGNPSGC